MTKVLVSDKIHPEFIDTLEEIGIQVDYEPNIERERLSDIIPDYDGLIVRSRTKVTRDLIEKGSKLHVIGRAGVGLDNIDVDFANKKGITTEKKWYQNPSWVRVIIALIALIITIIGIIYYN